LEARITKLEQEKQALESTIAIFEKEKKDLEQRVAEIEKQKQEFEQKANETVAQHNNLKVSLYGIHVYKTNICIQFELLLRIDQAPPAAPSCSRRYDSQEISR
jgi:septal ring factor EnvC (AmiA/AmiB activator)